MCRAIEDMLNRTVKETRMESNRATARRMLLDGSLSLEKIAEFSGLSIEEVKKLQSEKSAWFCRKISAFIDTLKKIEKLKHKVICQMTTLCFFVQK